MQELQVKLPAELIQLAQMITNVKLGVVRKMRFVRKIRIDFLHASIISMYIV